MTRVSEPLTKQSRAEGWHLDAESTLETQFRQEYPTVWLLTLVAPFAATAGMLVLVWLFSGWNIVQRLVGTSLATFFFFGRFVILGGSGAGMEDVRFFTAGQLALMVFWMDMMVASLLVFHLGFLFKLPWIGARFNALVEDGQFILAAHPWMKRATFVGIVAFVMVPLAATGSIGGSIFGRLLGLPRRATFLGIVLGSAMGCGLMYFGAGLINRYVNRDDPMLTVGGIVVIAAVIVLLQLRYKHTKEAYQRQKREGLALAARPESESSTSS